MPFKSKAQEHAAFAGALGPEMKAKAREWAAKTDQKHLPERLHPRQKKMLREAAYGKNKRRKP